MYLCNALVAKQTTTTAAAAAVVVYCSRPYSITVMSRGRERGREREKERVLSWHDMVYTAYEGLAALSRKVPSSLHIILSPYTDPNLNWIV